MDLCLLVCAIIILAFGVVFSIELALGNRSVRFLKDVSRASSTASRVSIIVPARNEEQKIEQALISLLHQDYPDIEIIVVNDRSTDSTGTILNTLSLSYSHLKILHLSELPAGWLGKNYALYTGSRCASGEYLLFTDADVSLAPSAISRAVHFMEDYGVDHLVCSPVIRVRGLMLKIMIGTFLYLFIKITQPWKARNPKSRRFMGIGAFNFIRRPVYQAIGTHEAIRMRPDDDMMLGKLVKSRGCKQDVLNGMDMVELEWYASPREMVDGMLKNAFAGASYSVMHIVAASLGLMLGFVFPYIGVLLTGGITQGLYGLIIFVSICSYWDNARYFKQARWLGIGLPLGAMCILYILWNSTLKTLFNNGIYWRNTHYSLGELKANKV
ncbi:MAG: glycosyltransferase [Sedimentisphaerales bacterium]|nr:glycosyltransferase [Sedimentisphaerales bacterium]